MTDRDYLVRLAAASDFQAERWDRWGPRDSSISPLSRWNLGSGPAEDALQDRLEDWADDLGDWDQRCERTAQALDTLWSEGVETIPATDPRYPPQLRSIAYPPLVLHVYGDLSRLSTGVAIVGTREPGHAALEATGSLARWLASTEIPVITGMARGIDQEAAGAAANAGGIVIGVVPGGPTEVIPKSCSDEYRLVKGTGCLVSETTPEAGVRKSSFLRRNRLTSGLARVVIVTATRTTGGTINQLEWAQRQGIPAVVLDEGAPSGFREDIPSSRISYHLLGKADLRQGTTDLWALPGRTPVPES